MTIAKETAGLLAKLGVAEAALSGGDLIVRSPVTGEQIAALKTISAAGAAETIEKAHKAFQAWRLVPAPKRGELVRLFGEELRAAQGRTRPPGLDRGRQDPVRRPRRSAGNDRHLRFRRRPVAPALRPDHRHRASRPPHDGNLASARRRRRHLGLQFPGRRLVVERGAGAGLRQCGRLEAVGKDAADRACLPGDL